MTERDRTMSFSPARVVRSKIQNSRDGSPVPRGEGSFRREISHREFYPPCDEVPTDSDQYGYTSPGAKMSQMGGGEEPETYNNDLLPRYALTDVIDSKIAYVAEKCPLIEIPVEGVFSDELADMFEIMMQKAMRANHKMVIIRINSPGGSVYALNRMLGTLELAKKMGIKCVTMCTGIAMSCGSILLMMGSLGHRYISEHGRILIHEISGGVQGTKTSMQNELAEYMYDNAQLFWMTALNGGIDPSYYKDIVENLHMDIYVHPADALKAKMVDHIGLPHFKRIVTLDYEIVDPPVISPERLEKMLEEEKRKTLPKTARTFSAPKKGSDIDFEVKASASSAKIRENSGTFKKLPPTI